MQIRRLGLIALAALAFGAGGAIWLRHAAPAPSIAAPLAVVAMPVVPAPPPEPAPAPAPVVVADKGSDLPTVEVPQRGVHTIDESAAMPVPAVTLHQKDGRVIEHAASLDPAPRAAPSQAPAPAAGGASFGVAGLPVHLFGVRPPDPRDRCGKGTAAACGEDARAAVAARLGAAGNVRCTVPAGQRGDPGFVCRDGGGVDLGGLLVAQGLALADTNSSYDYLGAQNTARSSRRGLWGYR